MTEQLDSELSPLELRWVLPDRHRVDWHQYRCLVYALIALSLALMEVAK